MTAKCFERRETGSVRPRLALALQGGGAHGAYCWGVLECLLAEDVDIVAVSGASAGALNGAALVAGLATGSEDGARAGLERLWRAVSAGSPLKGLDVNAWGNPVFEAWVRRTLEITKLLGSYVPPSVSPGRDMQALRAIVGKTIDLAALSSPQAVPLYVSATKVADGAARLFAGTEIDIDALMASACLPDLFSAVEIDGEKYWDGGYSANPALEPLIFGSHDATDLLIVQITPFAGEDAPTSLTGIMGRVSDIGFNACLMRDLKALTATQNIARATPQTSKDMTKLAAVNIHLMEPSPELVRRGPASKIDTRGSQIDALRRIGAATARAWLEDHRQEFGHVVKSAMPA